MTPEVKDSCNKVVALVKQKRDALAGRPASMDEVFALSQVVVSFIGYIIPHRVAAEAAYNLKVASLVDEFPSVKAVIKAKASQEYQDYRFIEYVVSFADQEVMLLKKLLSSKEKEAYL